MSVGGAVYAVGGQAEILHASTRQPRAVGQAHLPAHIRPLHTTGSGPAKL